jgi:hypothetical protein
MNAPAASLWAFHVDEAIHDQKAEAGDQGGQADKDAAPKPGWIV